MNALFPRYHTIIEAFRWRHMDDITVPQEYVDGVQDDGEGGDVPAVEEDDD